MSKEDIDRKILIPAVRYHGIDRLDAVFITHGDKDHTSGIGRIIDEKMVKNVYLPDIREKDDFREIMMLCKKNSVNIQFLSEGDRSAYFRVLWPDKNSDLSGNEGSLVLLFERNGFRALFTGDISSESEERLQNLCAVQVLKCAHHGSKYSTCELFLSRVRPELTIISAGKNNYGHPSPEVLKRLEDAGSRVFVTKNGGAVITEADSGEVRSFYYDK